MSDIKMKYPSSSSVALTIGLASLASDSNLLAGRESNAVDNTSTLDMDHLVSGVIFTGSSPTANKTIEVWAYAPVLTSSGVPTYPDVLDGTDSNETITSRLIIASALRLVASMQVSSTSNVGYPFAPVSIASLFGSMPKFWGLFVVHDTAVALNSALHAIQYERHQMQTV